MTQAGDLRKLDYLAIGLFALILGMFWLASHKWPDSCDAAAWVQAIGSILAVFAAFLVTQAQIRAASVARHNERIETQIDYSESLMGLTKNVQFALEDLIALGRDAELNWREVDSDLFREAVEAYRSFPLHLLNSADLISGTMSVQVRLRRLSRFLELARAPNLPWNPNLDVVGQLARERDSIAQYTELCEARVSDLRTLLG